MICFQWLLCLLGCLLICGSALRTTGISTVGCRKPMKERLHSGYFAPVSVRSKSLFAKRSSSGDVKSKDFRSMQRVTKRRRTGSDVEPMNNEESVVPKQEPQVHTPLRSISAPVERPRQQPPIIPPEVVFFGDPRNPPPASLAEDTKYHGALLYWARHATVMPKNSAERLDRVFPKGRMHPLAAQYRLQSTVVAAHPSSSAGISYESILSAFETHSDDLEASKAFIDANMDIVPSKLFLRAMTAHKLALQSRGDETGMRRMMALREKYILANDQLFFPLNIELQKAETRVMTYLGRPELLTFAREWDAVEASMYFLTAVAARLTWDDRVRELLEDINRRVDRTVGYMASRLRRDLLETEFRAPAVTAELYRNATAVVQQQAPELYRSVLPELRLVHETYDMTPAEAVRYVTEVFCPQEGMTIDTLKERLRLVDASIGNIQGTDYVLMRNSVQTIFRLLCTEEEVEQHFDRWYWEFADNPTYDFETYEPDRVPTLLQYEQRLRDTGNAFLNFAVEFLRAPTQYSDAFAGKRRKASEVGDWLFRDPGWSVPDAQSEQEKVDRFRYAYIEHTRQRKEAEQRLSGTVAEVMAEQDRWLAAPPWQQGQQEQLERDRGKGGGSVLEYTGGDEVEE